MESRRMKEAAIALVVAMLWSGASAGGISVYLGQIGNTSLAKICASGNYEIVMLAFLTTFGNGQTPVLSLGAHCDASSGACKSLSADIKMCQSSGVKVFLSLGGPYGNAQITSAADAQNVAIYLWNNFLRGYSNSRPLGDAVLDGIDFHIEYTTGHWDDLARAVSDLSTSYKKVYLSASPQCPYPDKYLGTALQTGLFDYVWIQFYNYPACQDDNLVNSWNHWTRSVVTAQTRGFYLGLPAAPGAATGYIDPTTLVTKFLPRVKPSPNYGGVMLWSSYYDEQSGYSSIIKPFTTD